MIHELGHLLTAKMFKVYCFEYAIGFGPKLFSLKRKKGETYFSLRAIPFGGFVSMYGEADSIPENMQEPPAPERSLLAKAKWKRAIIMVAGVVMNALLAIVLFFIYEVSFPKYIAHYAHITINKDSLAAQAGLVSKDYVYTQRLYTDSKTVLIYDDEALLHYEGEDVNVYVALNYSNLSVKDTSLRNNFLLYSQEKRGDFDVVPIDVGTDVIPISDILDGKATDPNKNYATEGYYIGLGKENIDKVDHYYILLRQDYGDSTNILRVEISDYEASEFVTSYKDDFAKLPFDSPIDVAGKISKKEDTYVMNLEKRHYKFKVPNVEHDWAHEVSTSGKEPKTIDMSFYKVDENNYHERGTKIALNNIELTKSGSSFNLPNNFGVNLQLEEFRNDFGTSIKSTFNDFANSATLIGRSLASLFTDANAWKNIGGIVAIGVTTTRTLQENGFGPYLFYWAMISVNLAIVNLLPFPGLDGWQLLVLAVEGIFHKEIPQKVKSYISAIGLIILFALMILIVVKDIIAFI